MKRFIVLTLLLLCHTAYADAYNKTTTEKEALAYFTKISVVELWSRATNERFLSESKKTQEGAEPAFFFAGVGTIQQKALALLRIMPVPYLSDIRDYHDRRIEAIRILTEAFTAGMNKNDIAYRSLQEKAMGMLISTDKLSDELKRKYNVTDNEIQALIAAKKVDVQWMEPIIKRK